MKASKPRLDAASAVGEEIRQIAMCRVISIVAVRLRTMTKARGLRCWLNHVSILSVPQAKNYAVLVWSTLLLSCSPHAHTAPIDTKPIPEGARVLDEPCSAKGIMLCELVSTFSGAAAVERRPACIAYIERSGRRVEQCGSLPVTHP